LTSVTLGCIDLAIVAMVSRQTRRGELPKLTERNLMARATDVDMRALRLAVEAGDKSPTAIRKEFKIGLERLENLTKSEGWVRQEKTPAPKTEPKKIRKGEGPPRDPRITTTQINKIAIDVDALGRAYEAAEETVQETCHRFGIANSTLYYWAALRGWVRGARAYRDGSLTAPPRPHNIEDQLALAQRLYDILGAQIAALAEQGAQDEAPADAARQLEQLIKCFKTIQDLRAALGGPKSDGVSDDGRSLEEVCAEIKRRLDQRLDAFRAGSSLGKPTGDSGHEGEGASL
jgi:hypothetical protein